jgi:hypothetical protein
MNPSKANLRIMDIKEGEEVQPKGNITYSTK